MKKYIAIICILLLSLIAGTVLTFCHLKKAKPSAVNTSVVVSSIPITRSTTPGGTVLTIPYFHATLTIPETFVSTAEVNNGVDQQSANYTDLACGTLALTTLHKNTLWLQYRDDHDPLCGTEIGFPLSPMIEDDINGASQPCDELRRNLNYAHCEPLTLPEGSSTVTVATWYQYIPDYYGATNEGSLAFVVAMYRPQASRNRMLIVALVPEKLSTTVKTFQLDADALATGKLAMQNNFIKENAMLQTIVKAVGMNE